MKNKYFFIICIFLLFICIIPCGVKEVSANDLTDNIEEQLGNIDLSELEEYFNNIESKPNVDILSSILGMLKGEYSVDYTSILNYLGDIFFGNVKNILPVFTSIFAIAIFCGVINNTKGSFLSDGISDIIFFVCFLSIILLLSASIIEIYLTTESIIKSLAKLSEIMSPIIITLMIASGGTVSASVYKPAVAFFSNGIINVFSIIILPLICIVTVFNVMSVISPNIKLKKFSDLAVSVIKWVIGLMFAIYGLFLSVQGITSASFDGISMKAAKYAVSNSIPLIGGFISSGMDLIVAGSVLIKNAIGVGVVFAVFYTVLSPIVYILAFSFLLKFISAITEPISDYRISDLCTSLSKSLGYMLTCIIAVGFMIFVTVLLMIFSANAFI